ncbi:actin organization and endocytosis protein [Coemansia sp. RSA 475]|nr:actin organization and endocytosis protein [Coemansia sp. RSA 475]
MNGQQGQLSLSFVPANDAQAYVRSFQSNVGAGALRIGGDAARQVLMQSRLPVNELGRIWELSDMHKQGSLSLPEFALAMFLAQSRIKGKALPDTLPPAIRAEVDAANSRATHVPLATTPALHTPAANPLVMTQPQMSMQMVGMNRMLPPPNSMGSMSMAQSNPMSMGQSNPMSMTQSNPMSMAQSNSMSMTQSNPMSMAQSNPMSMTQSVPTVQATAESVDDFESRFPDIAPAGGAAAALSSVKQSFGQGMMGARAAVSQHQWAISGTERAQYEAIFRKWDPGHRGVLRGEQAREVFAQSGLAQHELAKIWSLSDISNQGELNLNEFSVAMHLIFRRLAGAQIPATLPPELVPRSSKDFIDSLNVMKEQLLYKDSGSRAPTPAGLRASTQASSYVTDDDADNDDAATYRSANRRRNRTGATGRSSVEPTVRDSGPATQGSGTATPTGESLDQLRATVRQRRDKVAALRADVERRNRERAEARVTARWRVDELKRDIEALHKATPMPGAASTEAGGDRARFIAKRDNLVASIHELVDIMPGLATDYEKLSSDLAEANRNVLKARTAAQSGGAAKTDMESRAARLVAQRMAALTGQTLEEIEGDAGGEHVKSETARIDKQYRDRVERMQSVTTGLSRVQGVLRDLGLGGASSGSAGSRKWEDGNGVASDEVAELVRRLQRIPRPAPVRSEPDRPQSAFTPAAVRPEPDRPQSAFTLVTNVEAPAAVKPVSAAQRLRAASSQEERNRILQEIAEERFRERERALNGPEPEPEPVVEPVKQTEPVKNQDYNFESRFPSFKQDSLTVEDEGTPFKSPITPDPKPEMSQRAPLRAEKPEMDSAINNPFGAHIADKRPTSNYSSIFDQSLEVAADSDSSSDEWDHDSSDDENDDPLGPKQPKPLAAQAQDANMASGSSASFNTAFANPSASETKPSDDLEALAKEETNPFLGLLAAAASVANDADKSDAKPTASVPTADLLSGDAPVDFKQLRVRALYPYAADATADELAIDTGDLIETRPIPSGASSTEAHAGDGWMYGEILKESSDDQGDGWQPSGKCGWFPTEYADTLGEPGTRGWNKTKARFGSAKYDYEPQHDDELKVVLGERVRVIDGDIDESWWKVRRIKPVDGQRSEGMLPAMYIDIDK